MIRKYHNHKPQTTLWHREEELLNHHETPGSQIKQSNQLSLPHQDDCNTRTETKQRTTKDRTITDSKLESTAQQSIVKKLTVPWVGLQCVIVVFPDYTHLLFDSRSMDSQAFNVSLGVLHNNQTVCHG